MKIINMNVIITAKTNLVGVFELEFFFFFTGFESAIFLLFFNLCLKKNLGTLFTFLIESFQFLFIFYPSNYLFAAT